MTKWICKECGTMPCRLEDGDATISPDRCPITNMRACWKRDCTTEEKKDELTEGIDWRMTTHYNAKRINDLEKKVQELERELKNHYHETGFPK